MSWIERIAQVGGGMSWSAALAADFHEGVGEIFVPFPIASPGGFVGSRRVDLPVLGERLVIYAREQARWLAIDSTSEILVDHGLSEQEVSEMNNLAHRIEDLAVEHALVMSYG